MVMAWLLLSWTHNIKSVKILAWLGRRSQRITPGEEVIGSWWWLGMGESFCLGLRSLKFFSFSCGWSCMWASLTGLYGLLREVRWRPGGMDKINTHFTNVWHFQVIKIIFKNYFKMTWCREGLVGRMKKSVRVEGVWEGIPEVMVTICYIQIGNC